MLILTDGALDRIDDDTLDLIAGVLVELLVLLVGSGILAEETPGVTMWFTVGVEFEYACAFGFSEFSIPQAINEMPEMARTVKVINFFIKILYDWIV